MFSGHFAMAVWRSKCPKRNHVARTGGRAHARNITRHAGLLLVARTLRFPLGGFPVFSRAKLEVGDPYYRFLDNLEVVLRVYGRLLSGGMPRIATELSEAVIRSSDHSGPDSRAAGPGDR